MAEPFDTGRIVVDLRGVSFAYGSDEVLTGVNLHVHHREFVSIVGPNGGGKSTLVKIVLGLLAPASGEVRVLGGPPAAAAPRIGYMPQHARLDPKFPATVRDVVLMGRLGMGGGFGPYRRADREAAVLALERVDLADLARRPLSDLSGGQRQRALIARALVCDPEILVLDEPMASLDAQAEFKLFDLLVALNRERAILLVSHDLGLVSRFVHTVVCVKRRVEVHPTTELTGEMIQTLYGGEMRLVRHDHRCAEEGHTCRRF